MSKKAREIILAELEREQIRLAELERQVRESTVKLEALRAELSSGGEQPVTSTCAEASATYETGPASSEAKIALFRSLFRGRTDVFPLRWESRKTGRAGYSPACANEWAYGLCAKKDAAAKKRSGSICGDCENQAFRPVTDGEVLKHLQGHQVMGVYQSIGYTRSSATDASQMTLDTTGTR